MYMTSVRKARLYSFRRWDLLIRILNLPAQMIRNRFTILDLVYEAGLLPSYAAELRAAMASD